jgi:hypothetical protein
LGKILGRRKVEKRVMELYMACHSFGESKVAACWRRAISSARGCLHEPVGGVGAAGGMLFCPAGVDGEGADKVVMAIRRVVGTRK